MFSWPYRIEAWFDEEEETMKYSLEHRNNNEDVDEFDGLYDEITSDCVEYEFCDLVITEFVIHNALMDYLRNLYNKKGETFDINKEMSDIVRLIKMHNRYIEKEKLKNVNNTIPIIRKQQTDVQKIVRKYLLKILSTDGYSE